MDDVVSEREGRQPPALLGRARERAAIDALLHDARRGVSGAVVVAGPAGIGKSSMLRDAVESASDFRILHVAGVESEMAFGFAGVHQLVFPLASALDELPDPQRLALQAALGIVQLDPPDPYLVGLAVLTLLADIGRVQPTLVMIDDAQWLDDESLTILSFVARRLHDDRVAVVVAIRTSPESRACFEGVRRLELAGLASAEALELLTSAAGGALAPDVADLLVSACEGHPLALAEIPRALTDEQLRGGAPLPDPLPIGARLSTIFEPRLQGLDDAGRNLLLLASAEREGDPRLLQRAASALVHGRWDDVVEAVEASGLVAFTPNVEFRHPLVRSAIYHAATRTQRRAAHAALAGVLDPEVEPDRRAWHVAASTVEPDEAVASELEAASERLRRRGGAGVASAYLQSAADLTPEPSRANDRLLEAARIEVTAGRTNRAQELLDRASATGLDVRQRTGAAWTAALISFVAGDVREAGAVLIDTLPDVALVDPEVTLGVCVAADAIALEGGHLLDDASRLAIVEGTRRICAAAEVPKPLRQLVLGVAALLADGHDAALPQLRAVVNSATRDRSRFEHAAGHHLHIVYLDTVLAAVAFLDDRAWDELTRTWVDLARRTGALAALPVALGLRSWLEVLQGRPGSAASHLAEAQDLVSLTGLTGLLGTPAAAQVLADAWRGDEDATRSGARRMMQNGHEQGRGIAVDQAYAALTVLEVGGGQYDAALRTAQRAFEHEGTRLGGVALADLVEAATRCGQGDVAERAVAELSVEVGASGSPWARGLLLRSQALLAPGDEAGELFGAAIDELSRSTLVTEQARTNLMFGEWLRRARRRRDAREPLHDALETFAAIGAERFVSRTANELAATGEQVRKRSAPTTTLTPQEAQIARLAATGERNHDIAAQLYITTSTVEYHLRKVFVKLGVTSRTQLAQVNLPG